MANDNKKKDNKIQPKKAEKPAKVEKPKKEVKPKPAKAEKPKKEVKPKPAKAEKPKKDEKAKKPAPKKTEKKSGEGKFSQYITGLLFAKMVKGGATELRTNAEEVNKLNVFPVPDGDTGDNMRMTIESGIAAIENLDSDDLADVMKVFSHGMLLGARGNSGVILSQLFAGMATSLQHSTQADTVAFAQALQR